jgi:uncharacterized membrane protein YjfL (UPF0719 family)
MALITIFGVLALIVGAILYGSLTWGLVLYKFWGWFLIPFFGAAFPDVTINPIGYWSAVALFIFMVFFRIESMSKKSKEEDVSMALLAPWIVLAMGWVLKLLLPI